VITQASEVGKGIVSSKGKVSKEKSHNTKVGAAAMGSSHGSKSSHNVRTALARHPITSVHG